MNRIPPEDNQVNTEEYPESTFEETMLQAACVDLVAQGLKGKRLMAELFARNENFPDPVPRDFIYALCAQYTDPIQEAIDTNNVKELFKIAPLLAQLAPVEWGIVKQEIKERYDKQVNMNDLVSAVKYEQRKIKLQQDGAKKDVADIAREWASSHRDEWAYDLDIDVWRAWNGAYWIEQPKTHLLDKEAVAALQDAETAVTSLSSLKAFERLAEADCIRDFTRKPGLINFDNGTLELATGQRGYRKEDNLTSCLPYSYNPFEAHPKIDRFLAEALPDEYARLALMAHVGLSLMGDTYMHAFYVLIGAPRSGKSTILALLNALCGAVDPLAFAGHSIFSRDLEGKRSRFKWVQRQIVCVDELPQEALREEELLKAMSAHSGVEMRGIGRDEHTNNRWKPKLIMATNEQPRYRDTSSAIKERAIFTEITKARPKKERDAKLLDKLLPERGMFAASCLDLAVQVLERGYYPLSAGMQQLRDRIANEGNPFKDFLQERCIIREGEKVPTSNLHAAYERYCEDNGHKRRMAANTISTVLRSMNLGIEVKHIRYEGKLQRGLVGIRLRIEDDPEDFTPAYTDDEPLTRPKMLTVVNDVNDTEKDTVNTSSRSTGSFTADVNGVNDQNTYSVRTETPTPCDEDAQGRCNPIESNSKKKPYTPLTSDVEQPGERDEHVNGHKSGIVNIVNTPPFRIGQRVNTPKGRETVTRLGLTRVSVTSNGGISTNSWPYHLVIPVEEDVDEFNV